ncbi:MAG: HAD family hydrolase [Thiotrichales bacterium]|nr:HAD family hydrolase [Thiotrichales bacterium]
MIQLVVIDLDGTLLNAHHQIGLKTRAILRQLHQTGVRLMVATGRHYCDVRQIVASLDLPVSLITSNGARMHDCEGRLLYESYIPAALAQQVLDLSVKHPVHRNLYQGDNWWVEQENLPLLEIHQASGFGYRKVDFSTLALGQIDKFYFNAAHERLVPLQQQLQAAFADRLAITFTTDIYLEVMNFGVSKGSALAQWCAQKNLRAEEVMAFGDGFNDVDMLQWVGHPVLMANAARELKVQLPHAAAALSNAQEGVADYLQAHFLA